MNEDEILDILRTQALSHGCMGGSPNYLPEKVSEAVDFKPHDWIMDSISEIIELVNHKAQAASIGVEKDD